MIGENDLCTWTDHIIVYMVERSRRCCEICMMWFPWADALHTDIMLIKGDVLARRTRIVSAHPCISAGVFFATFVQPPTPPFLLNLIDEL